MKSDICPACGQPMPIGAEPVNPLNDIEVDELEWMLLTAELAFMNPWFVHEGARS